MSVLGFSEGYRQYFEVVPAVTEALKRQNFRLRHEVYCRDLSYEPLRADGLESDAYDEHSRHCLIRALASGTFIGCARIVLCNPQDPTLPLPFEAACVTTLNRGIIDPAKLDRTKIAEISRLAILGRYRRRKGEATRPFALETHADEGSQLRLPYLPVALYLALLALSRQEGIETLFVLTESRLASSINRLGGKLIPVGSPIEHRGTRLPSMMNVDATIAGMNDYVRAFFDMISAEIASGTKFPRESPINDEELIGSLLRA